MQTYHEYLLITAASCLLISLALAWLASFIVYGKVGFLKKIFPATHQLIKAHIDYLLMTGLLAVTFYMTQVTQVTLPGIIVLLTCVGALYNPFGFIVLAMKPEMALTNTLAEKLRVMIGFLPATIGYGYAMIAIIGALTPTT